MKISISAIALIAGLSLAGGALAQPSGGPDAKGNAPLKHAHTVNDGAAKAGANSFTQAQARKHIVDSGYTAISGLTKGRDGVWRGVALKNGATVNVALDFKGNVSEGGPAVAGAAPAGAAPAGAASAGAVTDGSTTTRTDTSADTTTTSSATDAGAGATAASAGRHMRHHRRHHRHHRMHHNGTCANPAPNGAACSGIDRNKNGISDKEDRALKQ